MWLFTSFYHISGSLQHHVLSNESDRQVLHHFLIHYICLLAWKYFPETNSQQEDHQRTVAGSWELCSKLPVVKGCVVHGVKIADAIHWQVLRQFSAFWLALDSNQNCSDVHWWPWPITPSWKEDFLECVQISFAPKGSQQNWRCLAFWQICVLLRPSCAVASCKRWLLEAVHPIVFFGAVARHAAVADFMESPKESLGFGELFVEAWPIVVWKSSSSRAISTQHQLDTRTGLKVFKLHSETKSLQEGGKCSPFQQTCSLLRPLRGGCKILKLCAVPVLDDGTIAEPRGVPLCFPKTEEWTRWLRQVSCMHGWLKKTWSSESSIETKCILPPEGTE